MPGLRQKRLRCWLIPGTHCGNDSASKWSFDAKAAQCAACPIHDAFNVDAIEGVLVADNSISKKPITEETANLLLIISHTVGMAINNSKVHAKTLDVAIRDTLTKLHNRGFFNSRLIYEVERAGRYGEALSLLMCDIDHFKRINDGYGHPVGDKVLSWVADILNRQLRKTDVIARYGGEEFAAILLNTDSAQAQAIAEKLRRAIEEDFFQRLNDEIKITLSFGVSTFGNDSNTSEGLVRRADSALYKAKTLGRNRVCTP